MKSKLKLMIPMTMMLLLLSSCGNKTNLSADDFLKVFDLNSDLSVDLTEKYNSYGGYHGDGIAAYEINLDDNVKNEMEKWNAFPLSEEADSFLESIRSYVDIPKVTSGTWKFINDSNRNEYITNGELCIYDEENGIAYWYIMDS